MAADTPNPFQELRASGQDERASRNGGNVDRREEAEASCCESLDAPDHQSTPNGKTCNRCGTSAAVDAHHCPQCGSWLPRNAASMKHGAYSQQVRHALMPNQAEALAALAERRQEIERDLGGIENLSMLQRGLVSRYLEHELVADHLGQNIATQGPLTSKGRQRAALTAFLAVAAQQMRIAQTLGLERRAKPVTDIAQAFVQGAK